MPAWSQRVHLVLLKEKGFCVLKSSLFFSERLMFKSFSENTLIKFAPKTKNQSIFKRLRSRHTARTINEKFSDFGFAIVLFSGSSRYCLKILNDFLLQIKYTKISIYKRVGDVLSSLAAIGMISRNGPIVKWLGYPNYEERKQAKELEVD